MKRIVFVVKYIKHILFSKNRYNIQSSYLFEFVYNIIDGKNNQKDLKKIDKLRSELYKNNDTIEILDLGAGSRINNSKKRKIKDIAKNSAKNKKFGQLLYRIVKYYKPKNILELGTSLGVSTTYLAMGNEKGEVSTLEGCPETANIAKKNFQKLNLNNIIITIGDFEKTLQKKLIQLKTLDLIFIDGNHQKQSTIKYFIASLKYSHNNTIFIFDDIHWSKGMESAWEHITEHNDTTLTIDLFFVGIVFIKRELSKENFKIRF